MKVLVTGGAGFVGSHLTEVLLKNGHEVRVLAHYGTKNVEHLLDKIEIQFGDVRFSDECREAVNGVDAVAHLGALISVDRSKNIPLLFWETNVKGTMNMLEATRSEKGRFLFMSTCEVLGHIPKGKANEEYPFRRPRSPYAASKYSAEAYCVAYSKTYGTPINIARCFNICGPRQRGIAVVPSFVSKVLNGQPPRIYGSGEQARDYTDVRDTVRGLAKIIDSDFKSEVFHLCSGREISVNEIANVVIEELNPKLKPIHIKARSGELVRSVGDYTKANELLGWKPEIPFRQSVKDVTRSREQ